MITKHMYMHFVIPLHIKSINFTTALRTCYIILCIRLIGWLCICLAECSLKMAPDNPFKLLVNNFKVHQAGQIL